MNIIFFKIKQTVRNIQLKADLVSYPPYNSDSQERRLNSNHCFSVRLGENEINFHFKLINFILHFFN